MTMTLLPARRAAGGPSCSDALEARRPARQRRELVWGSGDLVVQPHEKCSLAEPPRRLCDRWHFRNDAGAGLHPATAWQIETARVLTLPATILLSGDFFISCRERRNRYGDRPWRRALDRTLSDGRHQWPAMWRPMVVRSAVAASVIYVTLPPDMTAMRSESSRISSRSSDTRRTAAPRLRCSMICARMSATEAKSRPKQGFATMSTSTSPDSSRAS